MKSENLHQTQNTRTRHTTNIVVVNEIRDAACLRTIFHVIVRLDLRLPFRVGVPFPRVCAHKQSI